jgi:hypothetical protein
VPNRYKEDPPLGFWVDKQRAVFKKGRMDLERKTKLDELGFEFSVRDKAKLEIAVPEAARLSSKTWSL